MEHQQQAKSFLSNLAYGIIGIVVTQIALQLIVYPRMGKTFSPDAFGRMLTLISIANILSASFGGALLNMRQVNQLRFDPQSSAYDRMLWLLTLAGAGIAAMAGALLALPPLEVLAFSLLAGLSILRTYEDIDFRLQLSYRHQMLFYIILSAGYVGGILLLGAHNWIWALILGEVAALCYTQIKNKVFSHTLRPAPDDQAVARSVLWLAGSYLITNVLLQIDRFLLLRISPEAVSLFFAASLYGKILLLASVPFSSVMVSYVSRWQGELAAKTLWQLLLGLLAMCAVFYGVGLVLSPLIIRLLYPTLYAVSMPYMPAGNLVQVLLVISLLLMQVALRFCAQVWQIRIELGSMLLAVCLSFLLIPLWGLGGFILSMLAMGVARIAVIVLILYRCRTMTPAPQGGKPVT